MNCNSLLYWWIDNIENGDIFFRNDFLLKSSLKNLVSVNASECERMCICVRSCVCVCVEMIKLIFDILNLRFLKINVWFQNFSCILKSSWKLNLYGVMILPQNFPFRDFIWRLDFLHVVTLWQYKFLGKLNGRFYQFGLTYKSDFSQFTVLFNILAWEKECLKGI